MTEADAIAAVRRGDAGAFALLYERHHWAARRVARALVVDATAADDALAESFARLLAVVRSGAGPTEAFRVALLITLREVVSTRVSDASDTSDVALTARPLAAGHEDGHEASYERELIVGAFASLPERWQVVLWHTAIDDTPPWELAPMLGIAEGAVTALAAQARQGLGQAYLQRYEASTSTTTCQRSASDLAGFVRGDLNRSDRRRVDRHLQECHRCATALDQVADLGGALVGSLVPWVFGPLAVEHAGEARLTDAGIRTVAPLRPASAALGPRATAALVVAAVAIAVLAVVTRSGEGSPGVAASDRAISTTTSAASLLSDPTVSVTGTVTTGVGVTTATASTAPDPAGTDISRSASTLGGRVSSTTIGPSAVSLTTSGPRQPAVATTRPPTTTTATTSAPTRAPEPITTGSETTVAPTSTTAPSTTTRPTTIRSTTTATTTATTIPAPDLAGGVDIASTLFAGRQGTMILTLANPGPSTVTGVELAVDVPPVLSIIAAASPQSTAQCSTVPARVSCSISELAPGSLVTVNLDVDVASAAGRSVEISVSWAITAGGVAGPSTSSRITVPIIALCGSGKLPPAPPETCQP